ncbi:MAG: hypothetical protein IJX34_03330 [Clostridia bacterium]|nr:hypothetical protein [Clostridia bacterium]
MQDLYIYVDKNKLDDCLKYGIKLSEFGNKVLKLSDVSKRGIQAFLSPKDSEMYLSDDYSCIRVVSKNLTAIVFNKICENTSLIDNFICNIEDYKIGNYELPEAIICSSILPENLQLYNKILDKPLLVQNSREFYYEKCINEIMETDMFSKYELYQTLLILGDQKKVFNVSKENNVKMYTDSISGKQYTKRSN